MAREPRDPREGQRDERDERRLDDRRDPRVIPIDPRDERRPGDPRDERTVVDVPARPFTQKAPALIIAAAYTILGLSLLLQPTRWGATPAYGTLLDILPQGPWGFITLVVAASLAFAVWSTRIRVMSIVLHLAAILYTAGGMFAFAVRWATDDKTTPMVWVSWLVFLCVIAFSLVSIERQRAITPPSGGLG